MHAITTLVEQSGIGIIFLNVLLDRLGLPLPALPRLIVAGALVADGRLSGFAVLGSTVVPCAIADAVWYLAGWRYGYRVMRTLCRISLSPDSCVRQTESQFERWGASPLVFAKLVPLVAIELPTDRDIVVYCTRPNEASAAGIAKLLMTRGFTRVRPLLGGFDAWVEAGLAVDDLPAIGTAQQGESQACIDSIP
jgi:rhodanese-related sulfurtransferase